ncbi:isoprenylcysteine carboxyl methyltransferase family protein [Brevundimonas sp. TWP2-3-2]|uniref:isoprenylcysteine carboxyl methyltransferase family protein n=1 Tax=unclassified Brevundimonas TaxID=2622653 RepID=UPI003CF406DC
MITSIVILALVTAQRLGELVLARSNTARLMAQGGVETGAAHYPLIVALHAAWLAGLFLLAWDRPVNWYWMGLFVVLQLGRVWVIASLGARWTTRIITVPGETLVRRGPYRFVTHPNYVVVAAEIAVLPLAFGLSAFAAAFTVLNAAVLAIRIRAEAGALRGRAGVS